MALYTELMNIEQAVEFYGGKKKLAEALGISPGAVSHWVEANEIPEGQQYKLQALTKGKLKVDPVERAA